ncbi:MAG: HEPN domain-containing protein [Methylococcales bacterium]
MLLHPSLEKWRLFYEPYFESKNAVIDFVNRCEEIEPDSDKHVVKIMMHQTQRLVTIAKDMALLHKHDDPLTLLFLLICAENISKLFDDYNQDGKSKYYVIKFFNKFLSETDKELLERSFIVNNQCLPIENIARQLYSIRCDVVHEGHYWSFSFSRDGIPIITGGRGEEPIVTVKITMAQFRSIIIQGCINAIESKYIL